jgi:chromosomal replication initiation ATPase DnaA
MNLKGNSQLFAKMVHAACDYTERPEDDFFSGKKDCQITTARSAVVWLLREHLKWTYHRIGNALNQSHSAAFHNFIRGQNFFETDPEFREFVGHIKQAMNEAKNA